MVKSKIKTAFRQSNDKEEREVSYRKRLAVLSTWSHHILHTRAVEQWECDIWTDRAPAPSECRREHTSQIALQRVLSQCTDLSQCSEICVIAEVQ